MKKLIKILAVVAIVAAIGLYVDACDTPSGSDHSLGPGLGGGIKAMGDQGMVFALEAQNSSARHIRSAGTGRTMGSGDTFTLRYAQANADGSLSGEKTITGTIISRDGNTLKLQYAPGKIFTITLDDNGNMTKLEDASFINTQQLLIPFTNNSGEFDGLWIQEVPRRICNSDKTKTGDQPEIGVWHTHCNESPFFCSDSGPAYSQTMIVSNNKMYQTGIATGENNSTGSWSACAYARRDGHTHPLRGFEDSIEYSNLSYSNGNFTLTQRFRFEWCKDRQGISGHNPPCVPKFVSFPFPELKGTYVVSNNGNTLTATFPSEDRPGEMDVVGFNRVQTH